MSVKNSGNFLRTEFIFSSVKVSPHKGFPTRDVGLHLYMPLGHGLKISLCRSTYLANSNTFISWCCATQVQLTSCGTNAEIGTCKLGSCSPVNLPLRIQTDLGTGFVDRHSWRATVHTHLAVGQAQGLDDQGFGRSLAVYQGHIQSVGHRVHLLRIVPYENLGCLRILHGAHL